MYFHEDQPWRVERSRVGIFAIYLSLSSYISSVQTTM